MLAYQRRGSGIRALCGEVYRRSDSLEGSGCRMKVFSHHSARHKLRIRERLVRRVDRSDSMSIAESLDSHSPAGAGLLEEDSIARNPPVALFR